MNTEKPKPKIERDIEELKDNYGANVWTNKEGEKTFLVLKRDKSAFHIEDENVSVITNMGYKIAYIDYRERKAAFELK